MIELRERCPVDDDELSALHARAFGVDLRPQQWDARLARHSLTWFGAFDGERMVGFVNVAWDGGGHAFVLDTLVEPGEQGRGIGRSLVLAAARSSADGGCDWLHVDFVADLAPFYLDSCGFTPTAAGLIRLDR